MGILKISGDFKVIIRKTPIHDCEEYALKLPDPSLFVERKIRNPHVEQCLSSYANLFLYNE